MSLNLTNYQMKSSNNVPNVKRSKQISYVFSVIGESIVGNVSTILTTE